MSRHHEQTTENILSFLESKLFHRLAAVGLASFMASCGWLTCATAVHLNVVEADVDVDFDRNMTTDEYRFPLVAGAGTQTQIGDPTSCEKRAYVGVATADAKIRAGMTVLLGDACANSNSSK